MTTENSNPTARGSFTCKACIFYDPWGTATGQCRRHSPQHHLADADAEPGPGYWPVVSERDWCGEGETAYDRNPLISQKWPTDDSGLERIAKLIGGEE